MSRVKMYGIPNCDTIKKARKWLDEHRVEYQFHNYKKDGVDTFLLASWCELEGWEVLLNKRGTTWRKLADEDKLDMDQSKAVSLMVEYASMIKRPVLVVGDHIEVGFKAERYTEIFEKALSE
ncbi:MAG: ArsC family reductase [Mariprofundaceae bacterium]